MDHVARFRVSPGAWLTPIVLIVVVVYVSHFVTFAHREPYALGLTARAMNVLGLVAPVFAGTAAWEGARLRRSGLTELPLVRGSWSVAIDALWPTLVGASVVTTAAAMQVLLFDGVVVPDPIVLVLGIGIVCALSAAGFAVGVVLPRGLSVTIATCVAFLWFIIPRVAGSPPLDHVMGTSLELCCAPSKVLRDGVIAGMGIVIVSMFVAAALALTISGAPSKALGIAAIPVVVGMMAGGALAGTLRSPTTDRPGMGSVCSTGPLVRVCVWPEHRDDLPTVSAGVDAAVARWASLGVRPPGTFTEGQGAGWPADVTVRLFSRQTTAEYTIAAVDAMVGDLPTCPDGHVAPSAGSEPYVWVWLARATGVADEAIATRWEGAMRPDPEEYPTTPVAALVPVLPLVDHVMTLPREQQGRWAMANLDALRRCGVDAPIQP